MDAAFMPAADQSAYAFPPNPSDDESEQAAQRNEQIQAAFDTQRFQRNMAQSFGKAIERLARQNKT